MRDVNEIIRGDGVDYLLEHREPDVLVREYYSGSRFENDGYYVF